MMKGALECRAENRLNTKLDQSAILALASAMFPHSCNETHARSRGTLRLQAQPSWFSPLHRVEPKSLATLESLQTQTDFRLLLHAAESRKSGCVPRLGKIRFEV